MPMPKAAVNEDYLSRARQYYVGFSRKVSSVQSESESEFVNRRPNAKLWLGVLSLDKAHALAALSLTQCVGHFVDVSTRSTTAQLSPTLRRPASSLFANIGRHSRAATHADPPYLPTALTPS